MAPRAGVAVAKAAEARAVVMEVGLAVVRVVEKEVAPAEAMEEGVQAAVTEVAMEVAAMAVAMAVAMEVAAMAVATVVVVMVEALVAVTEEVVMVEEKEAVAKVAETVVLEVAKEVVEVKV